jgi:hypothetical protein
MPGKKGNAAAASAVAAMSAMSTCQRRACKAESAAGDAQRKATGMRVMQIVASGASTATKKNAIASVAEGILRSKATADLLRCSVARCNRQTGDVYAFLLRPQPVKRPVTYEAAVAHNLALLAARRRKR